MLGYRRSFRGAPDLETAVLIAQEVGFHVSKVDWLTHQEISNNSELGDAELEAVAGGFDGNKVFGDIGNSYLGGIPFGNCSPN